MASYVGSGLVVNSTASQASYTTGTDGGANYTVGSGSNRAVFIAVHGYTNLTADTPGATSVTHNGQSATRVAATPNNTRNWVEIWWVVNPTAGSGGTTIATIATQRALLATILEANDVDQTTPVNATVDSYGAPSGTSRTFSLTTHAANALLMSAVSVESDAGTWSAADGATLAQSNKTGTSGFNDASGGMAYEAVATAGAQTSTLSWTTGHINAGMMVEIQNAAATGSTGSSSGTGTATGTGQTTIAAVGSAAGAGAATGVSPASGSMGTAAGTGVASGVGRTTIAAVGTSSGIGAASGAGQKRIAAVGAASGVGTATGVGVLSGSVGTAAGVAIVIGVTPSFAAPDTPSPRFARPGYGGGGMISGNLGGGSISGSLRSGSL